MNRTKGDMKLLHSGIELIANLADRLADKGLDSDLASVVPGLDRIAKACILAIEWKKQLDIQKIVAFLNNLDQIDHEERQIYCEKMASNEKFKRSVGETLASIPNLDDADKPAFAARLFMAYLRSELSYGDYHMLRFALERLYIRDLPVLKATCDIQKRQAWQERGDVDSVAQQRLAVCGLIAGPVTALGGVTLYAIGHLGCQFIRFALDHPSIMSCCEGCKPS